MSKRVFDSSLSEPAPFAGGAETEDDDDAAPDEDDSSPDENEQPPSKTSKGNGQAPVAKQRGPNCAREWKEFYRWSRSDNSDAEIMSFIRADLAELNERAGITSLPPRHYDSKRGDIYWDWMYRHCWSTHKGSIINTTLLCPLVERCCCPCDAKIVEMPGQFILHIHAEHTAADHATDHAKFLTHNKQNLIRNAIKTVPMNTASALIKNIQDSPTHKIDPKLKESVARLFRHERSQFLTVVCDGVELNTVNSDICSSKTLVDKIFIKDAIWAHIHGLSIGAHNASNTSRHFALERPLLVPSDVQ